MGLNDVFKSNGMRARFEPTAVTDREKMGLLDRIIEVETDLGIAPPDPPEQIHVKETLTGSWSKENLVVTGEPEAVEDE